MKKVLLVSPHFPPINAPDMQRVRMALPHLQANGWDPVVLSVRPDLVEGAVLEPLFEQTYPADIPVLRAGGLSPRLTRWAGLGSLWWRCGAALARAGDNLLRNREFDLVFFSTTQFNAFSLGPRWLSRFGVPFVLDYQDPWINSYYERTRNRPPGGWLKFSIGQHIARYQEPRVLRCASGLVVVSPSYATELRARYVWLKTPINVLPFGASPADMALAQRHMPASPLIDFADGNMHYVYAGRCGEDMRLTLTVLFRAFRRHLAAAPRAASRIRFHFFGTGYAPPPLGRDSVVPVAEAEGVSAFVREHRYRIPFFDALSYLTRAQAILALGSDDPRYSASKIFPCLLAERPLLSVFHADSPIPALLGEIKAPRPFLFRTAADVDSVATAICRDWFAGFGETAALIPDPQTCSQFTSAALANRLARTFDMVVEAS